MLSLLDVLVLDLQPNPVRPLLATSGIEDVVRMWAPGMGDGEDTPHLAWNVSVPGE